MKKSIKQIRKMKKTGRMPLVSVVMPIYNASEYLSEALDSILRQTYPKIEFILIDDASTDNSLEIAKQYKRRFRTARIKIVELKKNQNSGGDRCANEGIKYARGKYIARMDADDIATPRRIELQVKHLESHPNTFLVGANAYVIDRRGKVIGEKTEPLSNKEIYDAYFGFHPLIHPTCMFRRLLKNKVPFKYQIEYSANNDYFTFFKLICKGYKFTNLPEKLLYYRIHGDNATFINMKKKFINSLRIRLYMIFHQGYVPSPKDLLMLFAQASVVLSMPEKTLLEIYLMAKGIKPMNPKLILSSLKDSAVSLAS